MKAHRSRGMATLFLHPRLLRGVCNKHQVSVALSPRNRPGNNCTGGRVGPRAYLDECGKSRPYRDWIPRPSIPYRVATPTTLSVMKVK